MNLLLLETHELAADGTVTLHGRRARHLHEVLRAAPGQHLRIGLLDGPLGDGEVLGCDAEAATLRCTFASGLPPRTGDALLLAIARPKVLMRMLAHAAALGFSRIVLFRSWRVDKSHLDSTAMREAMQRQCLIAGLEQSCRTQLPTIDTFLLFKPFVEDQLEGLGLPRQRFCAHPPAAQRTAGLELQPAPFALLLGPEGGLIPYEVDLLARHGFQPLSLGPHPLRTETALAVLHGQLDLLRQRAKMPG